MHVHDHVLAKLFFTFRPWVYHFPWIDDFSHQSVKFFALKLVSYQSFLKLFSRLVSQYISSPVNLHREPFPFMKIRQQFLLEGLTDGCILVQALHPGFPADWVPLAITMSFCLIYRLPIKSNVKCPNILPLFIPHFVQHFSQNLISQIKVSRRKQQYLVEVLSLLVNYLLIEAYSRLKIT